jgi:hypothetical protein
MSKPHASSVLPKDVALQVAEVARVPLEERDQFCDLVYGTVQIAWDWYRGALSTEPGQALVDAANAARILHKQLGKLKEADRLWVERLVIQTIPDKDTREWLERLYRRRIDLPWYDGGLSGLQLTVYRLAHLFSIAVGKSPPKGPDKGSAERNRTVKDVISQNFVRDLLIDADQTGGTLTFEKNVRSGTLIDAVTLLTEHLPEGVNPEKLSASTLQRIKNTYRNFYTGAIEAGFEPADVLPGPHSEDQTK